MSNPIGLQTTLVSKKFISFTCFASYQNSFSSGLFPASATSKRPLLHLQVMSGRCCRYQLSFGQEPQTRPDSCLCPSALPRLGFLASWNGFDEENNCVTKTREAKAAHSTGCSTKTSCALKQIKIYYKYTQNTGSLVREVG